MNIVYLIGNGFDINVGMNTRYSDFYNYYLTTESSSPLIQTFKRSIKDNIENWSDLEIKFGEYLNNFQTVDEFDSVFDDIITHLEFFLKNQEEAFDFELGEDDRIIIKSDLINPEQYLQRRDKEAITNYTSSLRESRQLSIITFNYTNTFEKILDFQNAHIDLSKFNQLGFPTRLENIFHIHGFIQHRMTLGVNDISQIHNDVLSQKSDIIETFVKPTFNQAQGHLIDHDCQLQIQNATFICLFGLSLGETDKIWWELIGQQLIRQKSFLILFIKGEEYSGNSINKTLRKIREIKNDFVLKAGIDENKISDIKNRIYVGYNTSIFNLKLKKKKTYLIGDDFILSSAQ